MEINSDIVGTTLADHHTEIKQHGLMTFAAATYDLNPVYLDDAGQKELVAPPMYLATLNWPPLKSLRDYFDFMYPDVVYRNFFHQSEYVEYKRPFKPGDSITIKGEVITVLPHQKGAKLYMKFKYVDQYGDILQTEFNGAILMGVYCMDTGLGEDQLPDLSRIETPTSPVWQLTQYIPPEAPYIYASCNSLGSTLHISKKEAKSAGMPGVTLQGSALMAYALRELIKHEAENSPERVKSVSCELADTVVPATTITIRLIYREQNTFEKRLWFDVLNHNGQKALNDGYVAMRNE